jgi:hypothetical protein
MPSHRRRRRSRRSKRWRDFGVRKALDIANVGFEAVPGYLAQADVALNPRLGWLGSLSSLLCTNVSRCRQRQGNEPSRRLGQHVGLFRQSPLTPPFHSALLAQHLVAKKIHQLAHVLGQAELRGLPPTTLAQAPGQVGIV